MVEVKYDETGFAAIIGQLIQQKLEDPRKATMAKDIRGRIVIDVRDMGVAATVEFESDRIVVRNGKVGENYAEISADFETINSLATGEIGTLGVLKLMLKGKLKIRGIGMAGKFQSILS